MEKRIMNNSERLIVVKFGGTSLANAERFIHVSNIINEDCGRRLIVPSAPGKDNDRPEKITELLIACGRLGYNLSFGDVFINKFDTVKNCYLKIARRLGVCIDEDLELMQTGLFVRRETEELSIEWAASRGEWLSGRILSKFLRVEFIDAAEIMKFHNDGAFNEEGSYQLMSQRLRGSQRFVVPGYYGQDATGNIRTFPRGGSDITGAYLAACLNAYIYENWTDQNGVLTADPAIVRGARTIPYLLYEEMMELGYSGTKVFHPLAVDPVWQKRIPVNVRNTFNPEHAGTWIWFFSDEHPRVSALMRERTSDLD